MMYSFTIVCLAGCLCDIRCPRCGHRPCMKSNSRSPECYIETYKCECGLRFAVEVSILDQTSGLSAAR